MAVLKGFYLRVQLSEVQDMKNDNPEKYIDQSYPLTNGIISKNPADKFQRIKFDFDGIDDAWSGYVSGFLYQDKKFLGTFYPVKESGNSSVKMDGNYSIKKGIIKIWGYERGANVDEGFCLQLNK
ncbi:MAG: hypothetical protein IPG86_09620 [Chitinophagaceae bacterium]|nr:hypothetical protein [Chitinophagaceae bacterium]